VVLVLQSGGALGACQWGVYEALHEAGIEPAWVIGMSIGANNVALIAANPPTQRLQRLQTFWSQMEPRVAGPAADWFGMGRAWTNLATVTRGIPGFFEPNPAALRGPQALLGVEQAAYYCTEPLRQTLASLLDFEHLQRGPTRSHQGHRLHGRRPACATRVMPTRSTCSSERRGRRRPIRSKASSSTAEVTSAPPIVTDSAWRRLPSSIAGSSAWPSAPARGAMAVASAPAAAEIDQQRSSAFDRHLIALHHLRLRRCRHRFHLLHFFVVHLAHGLHELFLRDHAILVHVCSGRQRRVAVLGGCGGSGSGHAERHRDGCRAEDEVFHDQSP
jgi:Patatin-like phospholipase